MNGDSQSSIKHCNSSSMENGLSFSAEKDIICKTAQIVLQRNALNIKVCRSAPAEVMIIYKSVFLSRL